MLLALQSEFLIPQEFHRIAAILVRFFFPPAVTGQLSRSGLGPPVRRRSRAGLGLQGLEEFQGQESRAPMGGDTPRRDRTRPRTPLLEGTGGHCPGVPAAPSASP